MFEAPQPQPRLYRLCPGHRFVASFSQSAAGFSSVPSSNGTSNSASMNELPRDEWPARLRQLVAEQVSSIPAARTVDPDRPLPEYGLDSLGALELRRLGSRPITELVGTQERQRHGAGLSGSLV